MTKIEEIYEKMCINQRPLYFYSYCLVKSRLEKSYFPFLRDVQPFKTDHGIDHVNRILEKLSHFLKPHLPSPGTPDDRVIDLENLNLLMHAVLWHDLGNLYGRIDHPQNIKKIFDGVKNFLYEPPYSKNILKIAEGHSGEGSIEKIIESSSDNIYDSVIYPQFLSALLRISDEIDEDQRRAERRVISQVPNESQAYWQFCLCTESILPNYHSESLGGTMLLEILVKCKFSDTEIEAKWGKDGDEVPAILEYISRLNKINEERIYSNKFLDHAFYFHKIDRIRLEIDICENDKMADKITFNFTDDNKGGDFFDDENVKKILKKYGGDTL